MWKEYSRKDESGRKRDRMELLLMWTRLKKIKENSDVEKWKEYIKNYKNKSSEEDRRIRRRGKRK